MALGTANTSAQARGKNKATKIKKRKEVDAAASYTAFQGSAVAASQACGVSNGNVNITYYHDGSHVSGLPLVLNDKIYTRQRANSKYYAANGHIKVGPDSSKGRYSNVQVLDGVVRAVTTCP